MLKPGEKFGIQNLLNTLDLDELHNLRDTVTKKMITSSNRQETIDAIISCIDEPINLLNRQKITRKLLFNYLRSALGYVSPDSTKSHLIVKCLELWNKTENMCQEMDCVDTVIEIKQQTSVVGLNEIMAFEFVKWFFPLYNSLNEFGTTHFWPDVKLELATDGAQRQIMGDNEVVSFLASLISDQKFYFHPNDQIPALKCEHEQHGMCRIFINGVIHRSCVPAGIFETVFGLVRNPAYNDNWKIKWIYLYVKVT